MERTPKFSAPGWKVTFANWNEMDEEIRTGSYNFQFQRSFSLETLWLVGWLSFFLLLLTGCLFSATIRESG